MKNGLILLMTLLSVAACTPSGSSVGSSSGGRLQTTKEAIPVDTSDVDTTTTMSFDDGNTVHASDVLCTLLCFTPGLTLVGTLAPPVVNSQTLQASDITVNGTKVYVAYNTAGITQAGGIDVINVGLFGIPTLLSSTTYADTDINKVFVDAVNSKLYLTGNTSAGDGGAILHRIGLDSLGLPTATKESKILRSAADSTIPAYAGTSVIKSGNYVYAVSGNNGGLSVLNASDLSDVAFTAISDARDISAGTNKVMVASGQTASAPAKVTSYALATGASMADPAAVSFANSVIEEGKSSIYVGTTAYIVTGGQAGTKFICTDGTSIGSMPIPTGTGLTNSEVAANAAAYGNGIVYVAQGGAGVYMYAIGNGGILNLAGCPGYTLNFVGKFNLSGRASANNVYWSSGYLVVATGSGGFQIIQVTQGIVAGLLGLIL